MAGMWILEHAAPGLVKAEQLNWVSVLGAMVVIGGSMLCALGTSKPAPAEQLPDPALAAGDNRG
jgi:hypothetical protein